MSRIFFFCEENLNEVESTNPNRKDNGTDKTTSLIKAGNGCDLESVYYDEIHEMDEDETLWSAKFLWQYDQDKASSFTPTECLLRLWRDIERLRKCVQVFKVYYETHNKTLNGLLVFQNGPSLRFLRTQFPDLQWMLDSTTDWKYANSMVNLNYVYDNDDIKSDTLTKDNIFDIIFNVSQ